MRRVGTIARAPLEVGRKEKDKDGKYHGSEVGRQFVLYDTTSHV